MGIKIYNTHLTPSRNALLDNIEEYLQQIEDKPGEYKGTDALTYTAEDYQYIKPDIDIQIYIDVPNNFNLKKSIGNYLRVEQNQGDGVKSVYYYFILDVKWTAQKTVRLICSMDTINTFRELSEPESWNEKTVIYRQHEKPFTTLGVENIEYIDRYDEGLDPAVMLRSKDVIIEEPNSFNIKEWYLVYQTENPAVGEGSTGASENIFSAYLYPSEKIAYQLTGGSGETNYSTFEDGRYGIVKGKVQFTTSTQYWLNTYINSSKKAIIYNEAGGVLWESSRSDLQNINLPSLEGYIEIGETFSYKGETFICESISYRYETGRGCTLAMGYFKSTSSSRTLFASNLTKVGTTNVNSKYIFGVYSTNISSSGYRIYRLIMVPVGQTSAVGDIDLRYRSDAFNKLIPIYTTSFNYSFTGVDTLFRIPFDNKGANTTQNFYVPSKTEIINGEVYDEVASTSDVKYIDSIEDLDRTDSKLVKIIALPYCPTEITTSEDNDVFSVSFNNDILEVEDIPGEVIHHRLKYIDVNRTFGKYLNQVEIDMTYTNEYFDFMNGRTELKTRNINYEPKLKMSTYCQDNLVYDNAVKQFRREDLKPSVDHPIVHLSTYYMPTNTLQSTMMFKLDFEDAEYKHIYDWDTVLISNRDNEMPIYNNDYLNYIRYSFKTESANLEASNAAARRSATTNAFTTVGLSTVTASLTGAKIGSIIPGVGTLAGAAIGGIIGLAAGIATSSASINSVNTNIENANRSFSQQLNQLRNTSSSVVGAGSSVDIMGEYSGNRLHYMRYELPELLKNALYDKLYYCGYSHPVQDKPNLDSRLIFNYIQCDPVFNNESALYYCNYIEDIKERYRSGVTKYHKCDTLTTNHGQLYTDWDQTLENWWYDPSSAVKIEQNYIISGDKGIINVGLNYNPSYYPNAIGGDNYPWVYDIYGYNFDDQETLIEENFTNRVLQIVDPNDFEERFRYITITLKNKRVGGFREVPIRVNLEWPD